MGAAAEAGTRIVAEGAARRTALPSVQMNTRIDRELKREGDLVLEQAGLTPTEAVRCLYELAVRYRERPQELRELLEPESAEERAARESVRERKLRLFKEGSTMCQRFYDEHGITPDPAIANMSYDELRELALMDEYGLLDEDGNHIGDKEVRSA